MGFPPAAIVIAHAILATRPLRRRVLFWLTLANMAACGLGWFTLERMEHNLWLMVAWWGGVAVLTFAILLLALYDLLVVGKEIRAEQKDRFGDG